MKIMNFPERSFLMKIMNFPERPFLMKIMNFSRNSSSIIDEIKFLRCTNNKNLFRYVKNSPIELFCILCIKI
jgi:hypothetical protein